MEDPGDYNKQELFGVSPTPRERKDEAIGQTISFRFDTLEARKKVNDALTKLRANPELKKEQPNLFLDLQDIKVGDNISRGGNSYYLELHFSNDWDAREKEIRNLLDSVLNQK